MTGLSAQGSNEKCFTLNSLFWNVLGLEFKGLNCPFHTMSYSVSMCGPPPSLLLSIPFPLSTNYLISIFHIHTWCNPYYLLSIISYSLLLPSIHIQIYPTPSFPSYPYPFLIIPFLSPIHNILQSPSPFYPYPNLSYSFISLLSISIPNHPLFISYP